MTQRKRELTKTLTIRLPEPVLNRLRHLATRDNRKLSDYVRLKLLGTDQYQALLVTINLGARLNGESPLASILRWQEDSRVLRSNQ